jgi:hypothetical protein
MFALIGVALSAAWAMVENRLGGSAEDCLWVAYRTLVAYTLGGTFTAWVIA